MIVAVDHCVQCDGDNGVLRRSLDYFEGITSRICALAVAIAILDKEVVASGGHVDCCLGAVGYANVHSYWADQLDERPVAGQIAKGDCVGIARRERADRHSDGQQSTENHSA